MFNSYDVGIPAISHLALRLCGPLQRLNALLFASDLYLFFFYLFLSFLAPDTTYRLLNKAYPSSSAHWKGCQHCRQLCPYCPNPGACSVIAQHHAPQQRQRQRSIPRIQTQFPNDRGSPSHARPSLPSPYHPVRRTRICRAQSADC
jgi:hypothetical protein